MKGTVAGPDWSEVELLAAAAAGRPDAVRTLLDDAGPVVYGFLFARVGGDEATAEDLLQDTFLEATRSARTFRGDAALTTWLCAIARRRLARHYEAERRAEIARSGLVALAGEAAETYEQIEKPFEPRDEVIRALGALPALHRQVLVLKYLDELSVEQVADQIGRSRVQVQSLLQRARDGLRRAMEASGAETA